MAEGWAESSGLDWANEGGCCAFPIGPQVSRSNFSFLRMAASMFVCLEADQAALKFRRVCRGVHILFGRGRPDFRHCIQLATSSFTSLSCTNVPCSHWRLLEIRHDDPLTAVHVTSNCQCSECSHDSLASQLLLFRSRSTAPRRNPSSGRDIFHPISGGRGSDSRRVR
jgi:hypothetical protein